MAEPAPGLIDSLEVFRAVPGVGPLLDVVQCDGFVLAWRFADDFDAKQPIPYIFEAGSDGWTRITVH